jgi:hypothetical protein
MKRNKIKLIESVRFLSKEKKCLLMHFLTIFVLIGNLDAQTPQIWPTEISFNYDEGGSSNDAVTIKKNASTSISIPEYIKDSRNESCAYIKSQSNHKIKVKFSSNNSNINYLVKATVISGTGIGNVCEMFVAPCDLNKTLTIDLDGFIPASVGKRTFTWKWEATALPINSPYCPITCTSINTTHTYYTLLSTPQAPMSVPWTDVLEYSCIWASGLSDNINIIGTLTTCLYSQSGLVYDEFQTHYEFVGWPPIKFEFNLTDFLIEWNKADCQDCSMFLSILSSSIGASLYQTRRIDGGFYTKRIIPIGNENETTKSWNFHQIGWLNNVYDPALKLVNTFPVIPININISNPYKTDLYEGGVWSPQDAFVLGQTDPYWNVPTEVK